MKTLRTFIRVTFCILALLIAAAPVFGQPPRRPNVLLIMADDLNTDLGTYGHPLVRTPNIDRLAARGLRFDRAYNQYPLCNPSRASLMTGLRPDTTRVYELQTQFRANVPDAVTLPQMFRKSGYFAARVGKIYHYGVPGGIGTSGLDDPPSWDTVVNPRGIDKDEEPLLTNLTPMRALGSALAFYVSPSKDEEQTDGKVASETIAMLEANRDRPFFIAAGFYRPHCPYIAPKTYFEGYPLERIRIPEASSADLTRVPAAALFTRPPNWDLPADAQRHVIRAYYASISFLDANVGRVLDALERLKLRDNTIVVFMSDHGYNLGEHGQWMKQSLFERSARAPLIIAGPGVSPRRGWSTRVVEYLDLYPTLAELAGLQGPATLEGRSLGPLLKNPEAEWNHPAFTQVRRGASPNFFMGYSVRTERWRYTEWDGGAQGVELYDESSDPDELRNLAEDPARKDVMQDMKRLLQTVRRP
jgi:uncharacterized sulfatase